MAARNELASQAQPLTARERESWQRWLWRLLERQTARYTMGQSTSVSEGVARELLWAVLFALDASPENPERVRQLLGQDPQEALGRSIRTLEREIARGRSLWQRACQTLPAPENRSLTDTLKSIGGAWDHYDVRYFAHIFPADIDYQLSEPVPETLQGVRYVNEYLRRLLAENRFLGRFAPERATRLLRSACPAYRVLLVNLFEPVAACALGLTLAGRPPLALNMTPGDRAAVASLLEPLPESGTRRCLADGADRLCRTLEVGEEEGRRVAFLADALVPRLRAALDAGELAGVFPSSEEIGEAGPL